MTVGGEDKGAVMGWVRTVLTAIGAITPFALAIFVWGANINSQLANHEARLVAHDRDLDRTTARADQSRTEILRELEKIGNKLDAYMDAERRKGQAK